MPDQYDDFDMHQEGQLWPWLNEPDPCEEELPDPDFREDDPEDEDGREDDGENCFPYNVSDLSDEGDALASAGFGTDEDYGDFGGRDDDF